MNERTLYIKRHNYTEFIQTWPCTHHYLNKSSTDKQLLIYIDNKNPVQLIVFSDIDIVHRQVSTSGD